MRIEIQIDGGKYPIEISFIMSNNGELIYKSEYVGTTISTFPHHKIYEGKSLEESISTIAKDLKKALAELLDY